MRKELYEVTGGRGFRIINDSGHVSVDQPFRPGAEGFQPMTEGEASDLADGILTAPTIISSATWAKIGALVSFGLRIGPADYAGPIQWYENGVLLGEVGTIRREAFLDYTPDVSGVVLIRAGNDTYGWAEFSLEVVE